MSDDQAPQPATPGFGAVTFLDVLGWKGIWQRKKDAIQDLQALARVIDKTAKEYSRGMGSGIPDSLAPLTRVVIISDTLVISTETKPGEAQGALELHGKLCQKAVPESIAKGIPVRGATSFGEFLLDQKENILVGKAIDEAASWHETADWIGVFMSPSAAYSFDTSKSKSWVEYDPPLKDNYLLHTCVVDWFTPLGDFDNELLSVKSSFAQMSPIVPEFARKFQNTIKFVVNKREKRA